MSGRARTTRAAPGEPLLVPRWWGVPGLAHGFLDSADSRPAARAALLARAGIGGCVVVMPRQVHGRRVVHVRRRCGCPEADGLIVTEPGVLVGVATADCVPLLLLDRRARAAAAVHVGWRGAAAGMVEAAVAAFARELGTPPERIEAAAGPAIGGCCYEVGEEVAVAIGLGPGGSGAWGRVDGRLHLDLRRLCRARLVASGLAPARVAIVGPCTRCSGGRYASYRRDGSRAGRQVSFIGFVPAEAGAEGRA